MAPPFADRRSAGRALAAPLRRAAPPDALVLALPRGGVSVGYEIARALRLPLDALVVRKVGVPGQEELAMGAIAGGGVDVRNEAVIAGLGISEDDYRGVAAHERSELERRERRYRGTDEPPRVSGRCAILVDDGIATGASALAAVRAARMLGALRVIIAAPVVARETVAFLLREADRVVALAEPVHLGGVGRWYCDFEPVSDDEVCALLAAAHAEYIAFVSRNREA